MDKLIRGTYTAAQGSAADINKSRLFLRKKLFIKRLILHLDA
ncbi:hypothetical protein [Sessilibacter sp. MAH4]